MLEGSGAVPRSTQSPHVRGVRQVALENARVQGQGQISLLPVQIGRPAWEHAGALEKSSPRQGCVQSPSSCLEKTASGVCIQAVPWTLKTGGLESGNSEPPPREVLANLSWRLSQGRVWASTTGLGTLFPPWPALDREEALSHSSLIFSCTHSAVGYRVLPHLLSIWPVPGTRGIRGHRKCRV